MDKNTFNEQIFNLGSFGSYGTKCVSDSMVPPEVNFIYHVNILSYFQVYFFVKRFNSFENVIYLNKHIY